MTTLTADHPSDASDHAGRSSVKARLTPNRSLEALLRFPFRRLGSSAVVVSDPVRMLAQSSLWLRAVLLASDDGADRDSRGRGRRAGSGDAAGQ
jgi:hypothetical protein